MGIDHTFMLFRQKKEKEVIYFLRVNVGSRRIREIMLSSGLIVFVEMEQCGQPEHLSWFISCVIVSWLVGLLYDWNMEMKIIMED